MGEIRILIADSDINNRNGIKSVMMTGEYTLDEASDGIGALKLFRRNEYQVVLLEAALPELDVFYPCAGRCGRSPISPYSFFPPTHQKSLSWIFSMRGWMILC